MTNKEKNKNDMPPYETLKRLYVDESKSSREIADVLGVSKDVVLKWLRKCKIPRRTVSEANKIANNKMQSYSRSNGNGTLSLDDILDAMDDRIEPVKYTYEQKENISIPLPLKVLENLDKNKKKDMTLTLSISDLHLAHENHLADTYWSTIENLERILKVLKSKFNIKNFNIVWNGDIVSGTNVYRMQQFQNLLQRGHWQVFLAERVLKKTIDKLGSITPVNNNYLITGTHECYDSRTEILTKRGFRKYNEIRVGQDVLTYNKDSNTYEWNKIENLLIEYYNGKMVEINYAHGKQVVTPNHRCLFVDRLESSYRKKRIIKEIFASDIAKTDHRKDKKIKHLDKWSLVDKVGWIGEKSGYSVDEIKLIAWLMSHGSRELQVYGYRYTISQKCPKYVREIETILNNLGINLGKRTDPNGTVRFRSDRESSMYIDRLMDGVWKEIPRKILDSTKEELSIFYNELCKASYKEGNTNRYYTTNPYLRDQIQEIMLKMSKFSYYFRRTNNRYKDVNRNRTYNCKSDYIIHRRNIAGTIRSIRNLSYKGIVWCPTVKNSYVVMRRDGSPFISGNSQENNYMLYLRKAMGDSAKYCSKSLVLDVGNPMGHCNILFTHGFGRSGYYPVSYDVIREVWKIISEYRANNIILERVSIGHSHWLTPEMDYDGFKISVNGGFQKWEYSVSQRPAGCILFAYCDGECTVIPVRPNEDVEFKEKKSPSLEYKNMRYYADILEEHLNAYEIHNAN